VQQHIDLALALSLHAPNNELRNQLVPVNKKYPLEVLLPVVEQYVANSQAARTLTVEYVMLAGVNDSDQHAYELAELLKAIPSKINLIPFNPFPQTRFECSSGNRIAKFAQILIDKGYIVTTRRTRGEDIDAACGQLVGKVNDRSRRTQQKQIPVQVEH
jgi:23S rRNA (adenine2503-C2)-methyltransferase